MGAAREIQIGIVGAGPAGLSAGGALRMRGLEPMLFDQDERIGARWASHYERLCLHTVRRFSGLAHHPMPRSYPRYVPKDLFARYLADYARRFQLDVRLSCRVHALRPAPQRGWELETEGQTWRTRAVVVATGHYNRPVVPPWPGRDRFRGQLLHSAEYDTGRRFAAQRCLVVGIGNSGAEIATDLDEHGAAHVAVSVRTPPPIMPREVLGLLPAQLLALAFGSIPAPRLLDRAGAWMRRLAIGDQRKYGLRAAAWGPFTARRPPVIDVGFLRALRQGRIAVRPAVERLEERDVVFADGSEEPFDVVVAATGFRTGLSEFLELNGAVDGRGMPAFPSGRPTPHPGLYFIGFDETVGGHLHRANIESRRLAREIERFLARSR